MITTTTTTAGAAGRPISPTPIRWPILPAPDAFAAFRADHPGEAADPQLWRRWARAAALYTAGKVGPDEGGWRAVRSQHTAGEVYHVIRTPDGWECECGDATWRERRCKHGLACMIAAVLERRQTATA